MKNPAFGIFLAAALAGYWHSTWASVLVLGGLLSFCGLGKYEHYRSEFERIGKSRFYQKFMWARAARNVGYVLCAFVVGHAMRWLWGE